MEYDIWGIIVECIFMLRVIHICNLHQNYSCRGTYILMGGHSFLSY